MKEDESQCVFCRILSNELPASVVFQDAQCAAFMDIRPVNAGHVLIVPRAHAAYLADLDPETGGQLFQVAMRVAAAIRRSPIRCEGINFFLADGAAASQEIFHVHLHVIPRYAGDGFGLVFGDHYFQETARSELEDCCRGIQAAWK